MRAAPAILLALGLLTAACLSEGSRPDTASDPQVGEEDDDFFGSLDDERDGPWLYERNCSGCHGVTGAGDGETARQLGVYPRDFNAGGFSFGNTPDALFRTISSGIPGRSAMPAFGGILSAEERWLIVDHVRTLMPPQPEVDTRASVLEVGEQPRIARGKLPPIAEGDPQHPRGLLVGVPEGLTFEYDVQDVRLLAVRLGGFADREDWRDRGGGYLRPLGQLIYTCGDDPERPAFEAWEGDQRTALRAQLRATFTGPELAGLEYGLIDERGVERARVREICRSVALTAGGAFERRLTVEALDSPLQLCLRLAGDRESEFKGQPGMHVLTATGLGVVELEAPYWVTGKRARTPFPERASVTECVWLELPDGARRVADGRAVRVLIELEAGAAGEVTATVLQLPDAGPERLAELTEELTR